MKNQENFEYLKSFLGESAVNTYFKVHNLKKSNVDVSVSTNERIAYDTIKHCLKVMNGFEDNKWWLSDSYAEIAYHQIQTKHCMLVSFSKYKKSLKKLLKRDVSVFEIISNNALQDEVERVYSQAS